MRKGKESGILRDFFIGVVLFVVIQSIFMIAGLLIEKNRGSLITGIPSSIGITIIILLSIYLNLRGKEYMFFGSFLLAFLVPVILFVFIIFGKAQLSIPIIYYSLTYITFLVSITYLYLTIKIWRKK